MRTPILENQYLKVDKKINMLNNSDTCDKIFR